MRALVKQYWPALLSGTAATLPFASQLLHWIIFDETGIRLAFGEWLFHLLATSAVGLVGLPMFSAFIYRTRRSKPRPPYLRLLLLGFLAATVINAVWLALLEQDAWCGGRLRDCDVGWR